MIMPNATGHVFASDGRLLRVDVIAGRWVASRYGPNLVVTQRVIGTNHQTGALDRVSSASPASCPSPATQVPSDAGPVHVKPSSDQHGSCRLAR